MAAIDGNTPLCTGIGVVAPTGIGVESHWQAILGGKTGIDRISRFDPAAYPVKLSGQVRDFVAKGRVPGRLIPQTDHWTHMALRATELALSDAAVNPASLPEYEMAVVTSSSSGGTEFGQHEMTRLYQHGPSWVSAYQSIAWFYAATTGQVSIRNGMRGPCGVVCAEQAGGLAALGQARRLVRSGESRLVVSGGTDAALCPYGLTAQLASGSLSTVDDPETAYLPFDQDAAGFLPGEGGAILILEDAGRIGERAQQDAYGVILGHATGFDPRPESARAPALRATLARALDDARVDAADVDVVFADAMGVPELDIVEAQAIGAVFGENAVPVTAPKTLTGRLYGGGASLDVATALLSLRHGVVPHTVGPRRLAAGCPIDLVTGQPRELDLRTAVVLSRGYGGFNAALVLRRSRN